MEIAISVLVNSLAGSIGSGLHVVGCNMDVEILPQCQYHPQQDWTRWYKEPNEVILLTHIPLSQPSLVLPMCFICAIAGTVCHPQ